MRNLLYPPRSWCGILLAIFSFSNLEAQTNTTVRIMAANLNGNTQSYQPFAIRIFQGLKPDIVAIQEFNYSNNTPADLRSMVDTAFGTNFWYFREANGYSIPNGIISRYPIVASGSWVDTVQSQPNRGYAWAQIAVPGTNDLYVVSVHLLTSSSTVRASEAANLKTLMQSNFPSNAWVVLAGDFNTDTRTESAMVTFGTYLSDKPIPTDAEAGGNSNTSLNRNHPHDYVLPSFSFTNLMTASAFASHSFSNGLVFDSRVYTPLSDVAPVQQADSGNAQHMAVLKDFRLLFSAGSTDAPAITMQPQSQTVNLGSNATFTVVATGTNLCYQWRFGGTNIAAATGTAYTRTNVQAADAGNYFVVATNGAGSATSANAGLTVAGSPVITAQPQSLTVYAAQNATFSVSASGATPLSYQWRFGSGDIPGATASSYTRTNVQTSDAGNYSVVLSNYAGNLTSSVATLTVLTLAPSVIAQWNFNSTPPDANTTTGTTVPSAGSGAASLVGGTTQMFASGSTTDPANSGSDNSAWNTATYPAQGTGNKTAGVQFNVSTAGRQNISIRWDQRESSTGSKYVRLQYSGDGSSFVDFPAATSVAGTVFEAKTNSLAGIPAVNDNPNFAFRIVAEFESTAAGTTNQNYVGASGGYLTTGTTRFDMVTVSGTPILTAPSITTQPQSQTVIQGADVTFSVVANGSDPLSYQWRFGSTDIAGATSSGYTRTNAQPGDAGNYSVVLTNAAGSATSSNATLTVLTPPMITLQPQDQAVNQGADASFNITVTGSEPLSYQWQRGGTNLAGATENSYTRPNAQPGDAGNYSVVVTNAAGAAVSSNAVLSLIVPAPILALQPSGLLQWEGLSNLSYTVQGKTNLDDANWITLGTASSPTPDISFTNQSGAAQQFYRVVYP